MSILQNINSRFRVDASEPPASTADLEALSVFSERAVPADYAEIVAEATEVEILVDGGEYVRIWSPRSCVELNQEYEIQRHIPGALAVGDDEGGKALVLMDGPLGEGLYLVDLGDIDREEGVFLALSLEDFLVNANGAGMFV